MPEPSLNAFRYDLTQDYLELARAALTQIHGRVPAGEDEPVLPLSVELANAVFSVVSITIVYSFLALESFLNYQLFRLWARRHDDSEEAKRFLSELGDISEFVRLKNNDKVREIPARLKTLCRFLGYPPPAGHAIADYLNGKREDPSGWFVGSYPRFRTKRLLRFLFDHFQSDAVFNLLLGTKPMRTAAGIVYFHHKGVLDPTADCALSGTDGQIAETRTPR